MAQFDLKKAEVYLIDGYNKLGAVNLLAGYIAGVTTMTVNNIVGSIPDGVTFTLAGSDDVYLITSATDALGNTTSITFTPGLKAAVVDAAVITFGGRRLTIKVGEGNITYDEKRTMEYKKDRGKLSTVRQGDEDPIDVKFDMQWEWLSSALSTDTPTPEEVLKKKGNASTWLSSSADPCEPYAVDILIVYDPDCSNVKSEAILLQDYRYESLNHDAKAGTISSSGKCNVTEATTTRVTLN